MLQIKFLLLLLVALIPVTYTNSSAKTQNELMNQEIAAQEQEDDPDKDNRIFENRTEVFIESLLEKYEGFYIPALPTINVNFGEVVSISLSLAQLNLTGISDVTVTKAAIFPNYLVEMTIPIVALNFGHYSSGGHVLNLPFSGEGPLLIALHKMYIKVQMNAVTGNSGEICVKAGSISFDLDLPRFEVEFSNMNPGTDLGQLLNIVLSSFGADIVDNLEILINGPMREATQALFVDAVNSNLSGCQHLVSEVPLDEARISDFFHSLLEYYLQAFKIPGSIRID